MGPNSHSVHHSRPHRRWHEPSPAHASPVHPSSPTSPATTLPNDCPLASRSIARFLDRGRVSLRHLRQAVCSSTVELSLIGREVIEQLARQCPACRLVASQLDCRLRFPASHRRSCPPCWRTATQPDSDVKPAVRRAALPRPRTRPTCAEASPCVLPSQARGSAR